MLFHLIKKKSHIYRFFGKMNRKSNLCLQKGIACLLYKEHIGLLNVLTYDLSIKYLKPYVNLIKENNIDQLI